MWEEVKNVDSEVYDILLKELKRQEFGLELIASENYVSKAVLQTMGSIFTNKYAEGYPRKRYYGGCEFVDEVETLAIDRAKELFHARYANVQPHSGSQANMAVYFSLMKPGDTLMGMSLNHGGHLTHGAPVNFSGMLYNVVTYGVEEETEIINYDEVEKLAISSKPKVIVAGGSAYSRIIDFKRFREIADKVGAYLVVDMAHFSGLVAAGIHPNPIEYAHVVTSTTHKTLRGPRGGLILTNDKELSKEINKTIFPGMQGGPLEHIIAAKAVAFKEAMSEDFIIYQKQVVKNAKKLSEELSEKGLKIVSNGTDTHLFLVDLSNLSISGKALEKALGECNITVNKNTIPKETRPPFVTSGIRVGTPAVTTRGMKEKEMTKVAELIIKVTKNIQDEEGTLDKNLVNEIKSEVLFLSQSFPMYADLLE
ncbi:MAG TPA: serine hydroxymethyltransferase [Defluviitoga sp.]|nr:serine hydroxymethyltransferase [Defluviitoga sp.]HOP25136.1 serine hydroxymethyltransferase [Defluviitoga sp.]HPZ28804.1 serine hydroxymethyltransferase [Defluviitoga sp.]HQD62853.1 serine hydroxymethyltransferase [Defluviitoga sp.]